MPMHDAAAGGNEAIVHLLVEYGARVDARADGGKTSYDLAIERGQGPVADGLKKQPAKRYNKAPVCRICHPSNAELGENFPFPLAWMVIICHEAERSKDFRWRSY